MSDLQKKGTREARETREPATFTANCPFIHRSRKWTGRLPRRTWASCMVVGKSVRASASAGNSLGLRSTDGSLGLLWTMGMGQNRTTNKPLVVALGCMVSLWVPVLDPRPHHKRLECVHFSVTSSTSCFLSGGLKGFSAPKHIF